MLWKGFWGFSSLWQVWKALGSFDVNMVCPLPGSWINHVFVYSSHICVILCLCAAVCGRQFLSRVDILIQFYGVFREPFIEMTFSRSKKARASQKYRVFSFTLVYRPHKSVARFGGIRFLCNPLVAGIAINHVHLQGVPPKSVLCVGFNFLACASQIIQI